MSVHKDSNIISNFRVSKIHPQGKFKCKSLLKKLDESVILQSINQSQTDLTQSKPNNNKKTKLVINNSETLNNNQTLNVNDGLTLYESYDFTITPMLMVC